MRTSAEIDQIAPALVAAIAAIPPVRRTRKGISAVTGEVYWYADLADDLDVARGPLAEHDIVAMQESITTATHVSTMTRLQHSSGQFIETELLSLERLGLTAQDTGMLITFGRRYQVEGVLSMSAQHDDDAAAATRAQRATGGDPAVTGEAPVSPPASASPTPAPAGGLVPPISETSSPAPAKPKPPKLVSKLSLGRLKRAIAGAGLESAAKRALLKAHSVKSLDELLQETASQLIDEYEAQSKGGAK